MLTEVLRDKEFSQKCDELLQKKHPEPNNQNKGPPT
jgi:hypothetical protein